MRGDPRRSPSLTEAGGGKREAAAEQARSGKRRRPAEGTPAPRAKERWDPFPTGSLSAGPWMRTPTPSCWLTSGCSLPRCPADRGASAGGFVISSRDPHSFLPPVQHGGPEQSSQPRFPAGSPDPRRSTPAAGQGPGGEVQVPREKDLQPRHGREERPPARASGRTRRQPRPGVILAPGEPAHGFLSPPTSPLTPFGKLHS